MEKQTIQYKDLSGALKTAVVFAYIAGGYFILAIGIGFIVALVNLTP